MIAVIAQIVFVMLFIGLLGYIVFNVNQSLVDQGIAPNYDFRDERSGVEISFAPEWYSEENSHQEAYLVGIINTLLVVIPGLVVTTLLGMVVGVALLSRNFMVKAVSSSFVELLRNTPLLVQLIFWYFIVMYSLPRKDIGLPSESVFILQLRMLAYLVLAVSLLVMAWRRKLPRNTIMGSILGFVLVEMLLRVLGNSDTAILAVGVVGVLVLLAALSRQLPQVYYGYALGIGLAASAQFVGHLSVLGLVAANILPANATFWNVYPAVLVSLKGFAFPEVRFNNGFQILMPQRTGFALTAGTYLPSEFMAIFIGLVIYTSAFIGEIVRAGIQAVSFGQIEAARALGFSGWQTLRMIIMPQALRVIIPPLGNQYLNLAKNSTLATQIAYADAYSVGRSVMNQSGQSVPGFIVILLTYLIMSLIIATIMNIVNKRYQLVTR